MSVYRTIGPLVFDFLWTGRAKIKHSVVVKQYFEGGLNMINLVAFNQALKITWLRRILQRESKWQLLIKKQVNIQNVFCCGSAYIESALNNLKNCFGKMFLKLLQSFSNS